MASGTTMNTKLGSAVSQQEQYNPSHQSQQRYDGQVQSRNRGRGPTARPKVPKSLRGTASQKNWYILNAHETRLNRLERHARKTGEFSEYLTLHQQAFKGLPDRLARLEHQHKHMVSLLQKQQRQWGQRHGQQMSEGTNPDTPSANKVTFEVEDHSA